MIYATPPGARAVLYLRRLRYTSLLILPFVVSACATKLGTEHTYVVAKGVYAAHEQTCRRDAQNVQYCDLTNIKLVTPSSNVNAKLGTQFGVTFELVGRHETSTVKLREIWRYPKPGVKSPTVDKPLQETISYRDVPTAGPNTLIYSFDDPWELVPGVWTLELWDGSGKLLSENFNVVAP